LPRTYTSRSTSSAMFQMKLVIRLSWAWSIQEILIEHEEADVRLSRNNAGVVSSGLHVGLVEKNAIHVYAKHRFRGQVPAWSDAMAG
jgi:hypothetical protein